jgi:hypothetical protein
MLLGSGALIAVIIIVLVIGVSNLGPMIKSAVNTYGPEMTKTEGFKSPQAMSVLSIHLDVPDIHLKNMGQKKGGASPAEAFKEIFAALFAKITSPAVTDVLNKGLKKLTADTQAMTQEAKKQLEDAGQSAKEQVKSTTDKLKGIFGK